MTRSRQRRRIAFAIVAVWIGVAAVHVRREYFRPLSQLLAEGAAGLAPGSLFYLARMDGRVIGLGTSRVDTVQTGFISEELLTLDIPALDTVHTAIVRSRIDLTPALELRSFAFALDSEIGRFAADGRVRGDSLLEVSVVAGGEAQNLSLPLDGDLVLPAVLPLRIAAAGRLRVGETFRTRLFDPSTLAPRDVEVRVAAHDTLIVPDTATWDAEAGGWRVIDDTLPAWRIDETFGGVSVSSWVDPDGRLISAESPLGFTLEREAHETARDEWRLARAEPARRAGYGTVIEATAIASDAPLDDVAVRDRLAVRLLGVALDGFDLDGDVQVLRGDTLTITRPVLEELEPGYALPYAGGGPAAAELAATPLIQAGDPRIIVQAREIAAGETDPVAVARRLNAWVYEGVEKDITLSIPSALQVLEAREGDCNEHTVLYVALARALGLPARTAAGLVHVGGRFYYHAWPEVWLGRWVAVDPTLGQFPADASHVRFLVGGLARQVELVRLIGRLRLEVVPE